MKSKEVYISVSEELALPFSELWHSPETRQVFEKTFPADIRLMDAIPQWLTNDQIQYLESLGEKMQEPDTYRMRIGQEVQQVTEHVGGVELPSTVLETTEAFQKEVVARLRKVIGAPEDN
jgi:hypothetical protein